MGTGTRFIIISSMIMVFCLVEFRFAEEAMCVVQKTCQDCLEVGPSCVWCRDVLYKDVTSGLSRCNVKEKLLMFGCREANIIAGDSNQQEILKNETFKDSENHQDISIQLRPQHFHVKIRPNTKEKIKIQFRPSINYPLDLYYLMDMSYSMMKLKETLVGLADQLSQSLSALTNNFRMGFGRFCDKKITPFGDVITEGNPCEPYGVLCEPTYSFKHTMELTNNITHLLARVNDSDMAGNMDNLEGALDGVVQSIVCVDHVKWANHTRKLILIASDGGLHVAGDGKLIGVVKRQDFGCHLDHSGFYNVAEQYDYASLAEVLSLLKTYQVHLIFAAAATNTLEYTPIPELLKPYAQVAKLQRNGSNIIDIITRTYNEIESKVILINDKKDSIDVQYYSNCNGNYEETSRCKQVKKGEVYDFDVVISAGNCPKDPKHWKQEIAIRDSLGAKISEIKVEVEFLCGCNCTVQENPFCVHGFDDCGACRCSKGYSGDRCDCGKSWDENKSNNIECIKPGFETDGICSGNGICECEKCVCDAYFIGKYCECPVCEKDNGVQCNNHGTCLCGVCKCEGYWTGKNCECPTSNELCQSSESENQTVCSDHGYCECGTCHCNVTAIDGSLYKGRHCETSDNDENGAWCTFFDPCVNATFHKSDNIAQLCSSKNNNTKFETVEVKDIETTHPHYCVIRTISESKACMIPYTYEITKRVLLSIGEKSCRDPIMTGMMIPIIVLVVTIIVGLLTLLTWKCWTTVKDRREFAQFESERNKTVYAADVNPIFRPAVQQFSVPKFQESGL